MANNPNILIGLKLKDIEEVQNKLQKDVDKLGKKLNLSISKMELKDVDKVTDKIQRQLDKISKQLTVNIKNLKLGNADNVLRDLNKQIKQSLNTQDLKINQTSDLKSVKGDFENILRYASLARNEFKLVNGELAKMNTITNKNGSVKSTTLTYKYDEARQAVEKYGWTVKEEGGKVVQVFDLISKKIVDNKEKAENSFLAQERYLDNLVMKLNKVRELSVRGNRTNENYNNSSDLEKIANLQNRINELKSQGNLLSEQERNTLNKSVIELDNLVKKESGYAAEVNKSTQFLEKQISILTGLKEKVNSGYGNKEKQSQLNVELEKQIAQYQRLIQENEILGNVERNRIKNSTNAIKAETSELVAYGSKIRGTIRDIASFAIGGSVLFAGFNTIKTGIDNIIEMDSAMRDLKKVTDDTNESYAQFQQQANQTAKEIGSSTQDYIQSSAELIQSGLVKNLQEAGELAKNVTIYQNIGDLQQEEASKGLIATLKAYNLTARDTMSVMDKMNEVSNTSGISVQGLNDAIRRGGSALSTANNSLSESIALITSANQSIQDASKTGNALKTISMNLRGMKQKGGETFPKLKSMINDVTKGAVKLTQVTEEGKEEFRSTYDIINDLSKVWGNLNNQQQAMIGQNFAGKQNANVFFSLMQNAKDLEKIKGIAENSANSAMREQQAYMNSLSGKINALKETWKGLTMDLANTDFLKGMIGGATGVLNIVKKLVDTFGALPSVLAAVTAGFMLFSDKFRKRIEENVWGMDKLKSKIDGFDEAFKKKIIKLQGERNADNTIKQAGAIDKLSQSYKNGEKSVISYGTSMIALQGKLAATKVAMIATRGAALLLEATLSAGIALIASFAIEKLIEGFSSLQKKIHMTDSQLRDFNSDLMGKFDKNFEDASKAEDLLNKINNTKSGIDNTQDIQQQNELKKQLIEYQKELAEVLPETGTSFSKEGKAMAVNTNLVLNNIKAKKQAMKDEAEEYANKNKNLAKHFNDYVEKTKEINRLQKEVDSNPNAGRRNFFDDKNFTMQLSSAKDKIKDLKSELKGYSTEAADTMQTINRLKQSGISDNEINRIFGSETINALKNYNDSLNDTEPSAKNAKEGTTDFGDSLMDLQDKAKETEKQIKKLKDQFDGFASEEKVIKDAMDEFQKTGKLSEDMISKILGTNDNKLIASLGDVNSMLSVMKGRLRDVGKEKINAYHSAVDEAVIAQQRENSVAAQGANNRSQIAQDEANNKNITYNDDVNNQTTAEDNKTQNAAVGANNRSGITNNETNNKSGSYATDVGNHSNAEGTKGQNAASTSDFIFARYNNLVNGLGVGYGTDVTNHGNAGDAKGEKTSGVVNSIVGMHDQMANNLSGVYGTDVTNYSNALSSKLSATSQFVSQTMRMYNSLKPGQEMKIGDTKVYSAGDPRGIWLLADAEAHRQEKEREKVGPLRDGGGGFTPIQGDSSYTPISSNYSPRSSGGGRRSSYKPKKSSYKPSKSSSGGGGKGSSGKSSSSTNSVNIEDIDEKIDRYKSLQDALNDVNNALDENATREELANNKDRIKYINNEIGLYRKKKNAIDDLIGAKQKEARELERELNSKGLHAHNGDIDNYTKALEDAKARVNRMANTDKSKEKAKKDFKELEDAANRYFELTSSELPKLKKEWIDVDKAIKDSRKKFIDMMADTERQVTEVIKNEIENRKKAWEKETDKRREEVQKQKDLYDNKNKNEDFEEELAEKQKKLHEINSKIESVRRDLSAEGQSKLKDYLKEQEDAQKDFNKFIRDKQREDADKAFDDQMDKIDKIKDEKEKALDENYTDDKIAELAKGMIQKGFVEIEGHVIKLRDAISGYYKDQGELFADSSLKMQEFIDKLEATKNLYSELNKMNKDLGVQDINRINNAGRTVIEMPKIPVPISMMAMPASRNIKIQSDLHVGTLNEGKPEDVRKMLDENNRELMKKIREENGIY